MLKVVLKKRKILSAVLKRKIITGTIKIIYYVSSVVNLGITNQCVLVPIHACTVFHSNINLKPVLRKKYVSDVMDLVIL